MTVAADEQTGPEAILTANSVPDSSRKIESKPDYSRPTCQAKKTASFVRQIRPCRFNKPKTFTNMAGIPSQPAKRSSSFLGRWSRLFIGSLKSHGMKAINPGRRIDRTGSSSGGGLCPDPDNSRRSKNRFQGYFRRPIEEGRFHWPSKFRADDRPDLMLFCLLIPSGLFAKNPNPGSFCGPTGQSKQTTSIDRRCWPFLRSLKPVQAIFVSLVHSMQPIQLKEAAAAGGRPCP